MSEGISESQLRLLRELARRGGRSEMFAPNRAVVNALKRRGLITEQWIGMRWTHLRLTTSGQEIVRQP